MGPLSSSYYILYSHLFIKYTLFCFDKKRCFLSFASLAL